LQLIGRTEQKMLRYREDKKRRESIGDDEPAKKRGT
jgi:hypothetical protein